MWSKLHYQKLSEKLEWGNEKAKELEQFPTVVLLTTVSYVQILLCRAHDSIPFQLLKILEFYFDDIIQGMNGLFPLIEKEYLKKAEHLGDLGKEETRESQKMSEDSEKKELHEEEHKYHEDMEGEEMRENRSLSNDIQL